MADSTSNELGNIAGVSSHDLGSRTQLLFQHLAHDLDTGQTLAEIVMQIMTNPLLHTFLDIQEFFFELAAFRYVNAGGDHVFHFSFAIPQNRVRPRDKVVFAISRTPVVFMHAKLLTLRQAIECVSR